MPAPADHPPAASSRPARNWTLWLWVVAGFLFLGSLWAAMFVAAHRTPIETVPLATSTQETKP